MADAIYFLIHLNARNLCCPLRMRIFYGCPSFLIVLKGDLDLDGDLDGVDLSEIAEVFGSPF